MIQVCSCHLRGLVESLKKENATLQEYFIQFQNEISELKAENMLLKRRLSSKGDEDCASLSSTSSSIVDNLRRCSYDSGDSGKSGLYIKERSMSFRTNPSSIHSTLEKSNRRALAKGLILSKQLAEEEAMIFEDSQYESLELNNGLRIDENKPNNMSKHRNSLTGFHRPSLSTYSTPKYGSGKQDDRDKIFLSVLEEYSKDSQQSPIDGVSKLDQLRSNRKKLLQKSQLESRNVKVLESNSVEAREHHRSRSQQSFDEYLSRCANDDMTANASSNTSCADDEDESDYQSSKQSTKKSMIGSEESKRVHSREFSSLTRKEQFDVFMLMNKRHCTKEEAFIEYLKGSE